MSKIDRISVKYGPTAVESDPTTVLVQDVYLQPLFNDDGTVLRAARGIPSDPYTIGDVLSEFDSTLGSLKFKLSGRDPNREYFFWVEAVDEHENSSGFLAVTLSAGSTFTTSDGVSPIFPTSSLSLGAPSSSTLVGTATIQDQSLWDSDQDLNSVYMDVSTTAPGTLSNTDMISAIESDPFNQIARPAGGFGHTNRTVTVSRTFTNLEKNTAYYLYVVARDSSNNPALLGNDAPVTATTADDTAAPQVSAPANYEVSDTTMGFQVTITDI